MKRIRKYLISDCDDNSHTHNDLSHLIIHMTLGAEILTAQIFIDVNDPVYPNYEQICIWALVDAQQHLTEPRKFVLHQDEKPFNNTNLKYIGTLQTLKSVCIFHLFECI